MAITVKHTKVSTIPDGDDSSLIRPSDWNDDHVLTGTIPVANGGTGAATLTGYVKGTGTSALTASTTIPSTDITGLGTMSTQNANAIAVTGGTINGTTIGATTATTGAFTTVTASTSLTTPIVQATNSAGLALRNSAGTTQISMGAGGGDNVAINVSTNLNGTNAQIDISPTGTGHVHMKPTGANSIEIAPTFAGDIDNMIIGAVTPKNGSFVDLSVTGTTSFDGSQGTAGQVLTSAGTGATPTWTTPSAYATVTDDTTTNATRYPLFASVTTGNLTAEFVSSTKFQFNPSTGYLTVTGLTSPIINNPTITNYVESVVAIGTVTTTNTIALTNGTVQTATLTASTACTFTMPTNVAGKSFILLLKQAASTGNGTATFTSVKWGTSGAPTITATAGKMDILTFVADGTNWYGSIAQGYTP